MRLGAYLSLALELGIDIKTAMLMRIRTITEICETRAEVQKGRKKHG